MTGTVLQGKIKVGDSLEIPTLAVAKKVKSMQMFRKGVESICHGDRAGVCVTQFDPSLLERGLVCAPGSVNVASAVIVDCNLIQYFKGEVKSKAKFHISLGHETVMAKLTLFSAPCDNVKRDIFDFTREYVYEEGFSKNSSNEEKEEHAQPRWVLIEITQNSNLV